MGGQLGFSLFTYLLLYTVLKTLWFLLLPKACGSVLVGHRGRDADGGYVIAWEIEGFIFPNQCQTSLINITIYLVHGYKIQK